MRPVTKGAGAGFATVTNCHLPGFLDFMLNRKFSGAQTFMGTVTVRLVGGFTAGAVMFGSRSFIDLRGLIVVRHVYSPFDGIIIAVTPYLKHGACQTENHTQSIVFK